MSEDEKQSATPAAKKDGGAELFRLRRTTARKRAMQFLYGLDVGREWACTDGQLFDFKEMLGNLEEDTETLDGISRQKYQDYMETLVSGVVREIAQLDALIAMAAMNWRLERMGPVDRCILRVATFEMLFVPKVSAATAINEAVELAKLFGQRESPRFINGVLDRIRRHIEQQAAAAETPADEAAEAAAPAAETRVAAETVADAPEAAVPEDGTVR
ncbi:MAG: transcription antitermination factor NusB [Oligosphaeraceae bacterium]